MLRRIQGLLGPGFPDHDRARRRKLCGGQGGLQSFLPHAGQMRIAQIELQLDPAPRFVLELATAIQIIDEVTLCGNQLVLDLVNAAHE
jgi:hypothetical protein